MVQLLLSRGALSSPTLCRFIPALSDCPLLGEFGSLLEESPCMARDVKPGLAFLVYPYFVFQKVYESDSHNAADRIHREITDLKSPAGDK